MATSVRAVGIALAAVFHAAGGAPRAADPLDATPPQCMIELSPSRRDTPSSACMSCHDGSQAVDARNGHRFDLEYVTYGKDLRPNPEGFNAKVVLGTGNKVTCLTCHDPASQLPSRLAAPTGGPVEQRLCIACHVQ